LYRIYRSLKKTAPGKTGRNDYNARQGQSPLFSFTELPMTDPDDPMARATAEIKEGAFLQNARQRATRRRSAWNLLLPALLLPLWFALGYGAFEFTWRLHVSWHPQDGGHLLEYWRGGMNAARFLMLIPPMLGALPLAMIVTNFLVYFIPPARRAMNGEARGTPGVDYVSAQRTLLKFGAAVAGVSAAAAVIGAWMN
jgi:hypothetical protein